MLLSSIIFCVTFGAIYGQQPEPAPSVPVLFNIQYNQCEGKDANNYTRWCEFSVPSSGLLNENNNQLIQCNPDGTRAVNTLLVLANEVELPAGAYQQQENLFLVTSGPLEAKYVYEKVIRLSLAYLSRFSSVLGYSYVTTKSAVLLIADRVDLSVLIAPTGAYDAFYRLCNTKCQGSGWFVA